MQLPDDDAQARYFGLVIAALKEVSFLQSLGVVELYNGRKVINESDAGAIMDECHSRGFRYGDLEVSEKSAEFIELMTRGVDGG